MNGVFQLNLLILFCCLRFVDSVDESDVNVDMEVEPFIEDSDAAILVNADDCLVVMVTLFVVLFTLLLSLILASVKGINCCPKFPEQNVQQTAPRNRPQVIKGPRFTMPASLSLLFSVPVECIAFKVFAASVK